MIKLLGCGILAMRKYILLQGSQVFFSLESRIEIRRMMEILQHVIQTLSRCDSEFRSNCLRILSKKFTIIRIYDSLFFCEYFNGEIRLAYKIFTIPFTYSSDNTYLYFSYFPVFFFLLNYGFVLIMCSQLFKFICSPIFILLPV